MWISSKEKSYLENSNQSILEEISPEYSLEGLMLKLKLPILWPPDAKNWLIWKDWNDWRQEEKGTMEDEMVGWHHWLDGCGFGWTPGVGDGQGGLACCGSQGLKESDTTELNWMNLLLLSVKRGYTLLTLVRRGKMGKGKGEEVKGL